MTSSTKTAAECFERAHQDGYQLPESLRLLRPEHPFKGWKARSERRDATSPMAQRLDALMRELEPELQTDALIVLDQVEEIITNPNPGATSELEDLAGVSARLPELNPRRVRPKRWAMYHALGAREV